MYDQMDKQELLIFLKQLTATIEEETITEKQLTSVKDFKNLYLFSEELDVTQIEKVTELTKLTKDDMKDFFKFLIVGCYMYKLCCAININ